MWLDGHVFFGEPCAFLHTTMRCRREDINISPGKGAHGTDNAKHCLRRASDILCHLCRVQADVNVIAWNVLTPHTLASGGDEGRLRVWDLRAFLQPVADFNHHR